MNSQESEFEEKSRSIAPFVTMLVLLAVWVIGGWVAVFTLVPEAGSPAIDRGVFVWLMVVFTLIGGTYFSVVRFVRLRKMSVVVVILWLVIELLITHSYFGH